MTTGHLPSDIKINYRNRNNNEIMEIMLHILHCAVFYSSTAVISYCRWKLCLHVYLVLLVKLVRCDIQKGLQAGTGSIINKQINGANSLQGQLRGLPVCQVHTHWDDGGTLEEDTAHVQQKLIKYTIQRRRKKVWYQFSIQKTFVYTYAVEANIVKLNRWFFFLTLLFI